MASHLVYVPVKMDTKMAKCYEKKLELCTENSRAFGRSY